MTHDNQLRHRFYSTYSTSHMMYGLISTHIKDLVSSAGNGMSIPRNIPVEYNYDGKSYTVLIDMNVAENMGAYGTNMYEYVVFSDVDRDAVLNFEKLLTDKTVVPVTNSIFEFNYQAGFYEESKSKFVATELQGYDDYLSQVAQDITCVREKQDSLIKLGALSGRNYLLYGPPGTGKSTFVKQIAKEADLPIFIVKMNPQVHHNLSNILSPKNGYQNSGNKYKTKGGCIVLLEDFDRYLNSSEKNIMSDLLNALDGIMNAYGVMRFFSLNCMDKVVNNEALMSRMSTVFHFEIPEPNIIRSYLLDIFPDEPDAIDQFLVHVRARKEVHNNLTIRMINNYLARFVYKPNPMAAAVNDVDKWFGELDKLDEIKQQTEESLKAEERKKQEAARLRKQKKDEGRQIWENLKKQHAQQSEAQSINKRLEELTGQGDKVFVRSKTDNLIQISKEQAIEKRLNKVAGDDMTFVRKMVDQTESEILKQMENATHHIG